MKRFVKSGDDYRTVEDGKSGMEDDKTANGIPADEFYARLLAATSSKKASADEVIHVNQQQESVRICIDCGMEIKGSEEGHVRSLAHLSSAKPPTEPPVVYGLNRTNVGFRMLESQGWSTGTGLGTDQQGRTFPIATQLKKDREGVGSKKSRRRITHPDYEANQDSAAKQRHSSSTLRRTRKDIEEEAERERQKRLALNAYMKPT